MQIHVYGPERQATGGFDGGKITEQKPIGFPREGSAVDRVGPLFYWAWAFAEKEGYIPSHPHQAFEIMTYVVNGKAEHGDSLGTRSVVGPGGAQVIQTGSGVSHEEGFVGPNMEGFQIWFEPHLSEAIKRTPTYNQYDHEEFPITETEDASVKTVIDGEAPVKIVAEARMWDVTVKPGRTFVQPVRKDYNLTALAIRGDGAVADAASSKDVTALRQKDFAVIEPEQASAANFTADSDSEFRLILIEVPARVNYPLYRK
ncbi:pirin family protein [Cohnella zeiphila]|uniref:Pirin family protein n=1 Tax=Cohnella zeiphila TaxID=2761120 RepID=A0A7X0SM82_9BACL|nr:pirin family protein [Cohnella zeiphila]MBB6731414.1 pirin family protein [Cohnella zeiphila]